MTAREELRESLLPVIGYPAPGEAESVDALLDAYRAEVLREAAAYLTEKYGVTNRAAGALRRLAELEAQRGL